MSIASNPLVEQAEGQIVDSVGSMEVVTELADKLNDVYDMLVSINGFLYRINRYADYIVAFAVVILLCILYYRYLEYFTR